MSTITVVWWDPWSRCGKTSMILKKGRLERELKLKVHIRSQTTKMIKFWSLFQAIKLFFSAWWKSQPWGARSFSTPLLSSSSSRIDSWSLRRREELPRGLFYSLVRQNMRGVQSQVLLKGLESCTVWPAELAWRARVTVCSPLNLPDEYKL